MIVRNDDGVVTPGDGVGGRFRPDSDQAHNVHTMHMVTWAIARMGISSQHHQAQNIHRYINIKKFFATFTAHLYNFTL